jgi:radical SAM superfamily enzyme YgiQ (UPF0313 family)
MNESSTTPRPVRLLLINPRFPESFWSFRWAIDRVLPGKRTVNPPLGLATLAALCPAHWQVEIVDENVESIPLDPEADLIGVCGMGVQFPRQRELLDYYRGRGYFVVAGGSYASLCPERYVDLADAVVAGEAEYIWPEFCQDFAHRDMRPLYRETAEVDLRDSPMPRFDLLKLDRYASVSLQFSRGCPYRCDFCDIIVMFGRRPRTKPPEQIGRELDLLRSLGVRNVFFVDDNFIGHKARAKELLRYLADYQERHDWRFGFGTEVSLNLAEDEELLRLMRTANFSWVFIGIETPDEESLKEMRKTQNMRGDILDSVHNIYRHGIEVLAGFIVGFDNDTLATFDRQRRFITASGIQAAMVGLLTALPKTPLFERLEREGRLLPGAGHGDNTCPGTNFTPKRMGYDDMVHHFRLLYRRLVSDRAIARRILNKTRSLKRPVYRPEFSLPERLGIVTKLLIRGVLRGGPVRVFWFLRTLTGSSPRTWRVVIVDWITGLSMRSYVRRHFETQPLKARRLARRTLAFLRRNWAEGLQRGAFDARLKLEEAHTSLVVTLKGPLDKGFFEAAGRRFERLLRQPSATLSLHIESLREEHCCHLEQLLERLRRYGDRVSIHLGDKVRGLIKIDSSVFHLVFDATPGQAAPTN